MSDHGESAVASAPVLAETGGDAGPGDGSAEPLPGRGQAVRLLCGGEVVAAHVMWRVGWAVHVAADGDPGPEDRCPDRRVRLVWRGETHAVCIDGEIPPGRSSWTVVCDPTSLATLDERSRRRVNVRTAVDLTVPTRIFPRVGSTWSINLSESGVALERPRGLLVSVNEALVLRMFLDGLPVLTLGRVVAAEAEQPVRVAFERMSPTARTRLIGTVNRLEAASRVHVR